MDWEDRHAQTKNGIIKLAETLFEPTHPAIPVEFEVDGSDGFTLIHPDILWGEKTNPKKQHLIRGLEAYVRFRFGDEECIEDAKRFGLMKGAWASARVIRSNVKAQFRLYMSQNFFPKAAELGLKFEAKDGTL